MSELTFGNADAGSNLFHKQLISIDGSILDADGGLMTQRGKVSRKKIKPKLGHKVSFHCVMRVSWVLK